VGSTTSDLLAVDDIVGYVGSLLSSVSTLQSVVLPIFAKIGIDLPPSIDETERLLGVMKILSRPQSIIESWLTLRDEDLQRLLQEARLSNERCVRLNNHRRILERNFDPKVLGLPVREMLERFTNVYKSRLRFLKLGYHRDLKDLKQYRGVGRDIRYGTIVEGLSTSSKILDDQEWLQMNLPKALEMFGRLYKGARALTRRYRPIPNHINILYMLSNLHASAMPQTKAIVSIENVVATASINQRVDLNLITKNFVDVEYRPDRFPGLVFRLKSPKTATLVFSSGKMVCTGAKSEEQSRKAVQEVVRRLKKGGIPIKNEAEIVIQNMVASVNLGGKIDLEEAARKLPKSMYEPEQFPGLIHRMPDPKTVILLFASGKLVCTGAKKESDVYRAVNNLHVMLEEKKLMIY